MNEDTELLRRFAEEGAEAAFTELVRGKVNLVYAAALRQTGGDAQLAQEVTQAVFLALARDAARLKRHAVLAGWLFTTTRFVASKAVRAQRRWQQRDLEAHAMNLTNSDESEPQWETLRPVIDEALGELKTEDRDALVLRFFEGRSLAEVGEAIGLAENTARMRVERALEKLRGRLARRGITSTGAALGVALANQPAVAAPVGLAGAIAAAWQAGVGVGGASLTMITTLKLIAGMAAAGAAGMGGTFLTMQARQEKRLATIEAQTHSTAVALRADNERLKGEMGRLQTALVAAKDEAASPLADLRAMVRASQQKLIGPMANLLRTNNGQLTPAVAKLFNLSPEEKAAVEKALNDARSEIDALAAANVLDVERPTPTRVVIRIKLHPEAGGKVYDRVVAVLAATLGPERQAALMALTGEHFDVMGGGFGAKERSLTFDQLPGGPANRHRPHYTVVDRIRGTGTRVLPSGTQAVPTTVFSFTKSGDRATIERDFAAFAKLLPADF